MYGLETCYTSEYLTTKANQWDTPFDSYFKSSNNLKACMAAGETAEYQVKMIST